MFEVFARYDLADEGETRPTYLAIASALNVTSATVTNHLPRCGANSGRSCSIACGS
jgi:hypothetical protein